MKNLIGFVFGRLTVVEFVGKRNGHVQWKCVCSCGNYRIVFRGNLTSGSTVSCGCHSIEQLVNRSTTHGKSHTKEFAVWHGMKTRCNNPNSDDYPHYGGRGVKVCDRWNDSFENFLADMGEVPEERTIDRIDTNGNYSPENCRWATVIEQNNNKRTNRYITVNGVTKTILGWEKHLGYTSPVIYKRLARGWDAIDAVVTPRRASRK